MFIIVTIFFYYDIIAKTSVENWLGKYFIWDSFSYWASYREITGVRDRILWQLFSAKFSPYVARSEWVIENQSITGQRRINFGRISSFLWEINDLPRFKLCYLWRKFIRIMLCTFLTLFEENGQFLRHVIYSQLAQVSLKIHTFYIHCLGHPNIPTNFTHWRSVINW